VAFQFVKAALFMIHLLILLFQVMSEVSFLNVVQWVGSTLIGVHYYLNAWHPAMMEEPPLLGFKYYAFYMYCFFMCEPTPFTSCHLVFRFCAAVGCGLRAARQFEDWREATLRESSSSCVPRTRVFVFKRESGVALVDMPECPPNMPTAY